MNWQSAIGWVLLAVGIAITVAGAVSLGIRLRQRRSEDQAAIASRTAVIVLGATLIGSGVAWLNR